MCSGLLPFAFWRRTGCPDERYTAYLRTYDELPAYDSSKLWLMYLLFSRPTPTNWPQQKLSSHHHRMQEQAAEKIGNFMEMVV